MRIAKIKTEHHEYAYIDTSKIEYLSGVHKYHDKNVIETYQFIVSMNCGESIVGVYNSEAAANYVVKQILIMWRGEDGSVTDLTNDMPQPAVIAESAKFNCICTNNSW